jgi:hypothetical protein
LRTTGINETVLDRGHFRCRISDIGEQVPGRTKWIHLFANTPLVIFQAAISSYDETTIEDRTVVSSRSDIPRTVMSREKLTSIEPNAGVPHAI